MFKTDWRWSPVASYSMFILSSEPKGQDTVSELGTWKENDKELTNLFCISLYVELGLRLYLLQKHKKQQFLSDDFVFVFFQIA